jgi:hypothetical protein
MKSSGTGAILLLIADVSEHLWPGLRPNIHECPLCAMSGLMHRSKHHLYSITSSARARQRRRDGDAGRLGGLEVEDKPKERRYAPQSNVNVPNR